MLESIGRVGSLRRGILGLGETFGLSLALLALVMASSLATSSAAGFAGPTVPLVYLTAGFGSLCLASVIIRFTRRMASAGGLYTYTARGLDTNSGFIGGWLYAWGFAAGISFVLIIASFFLSTVLTVHTSIDLSWFQCFWILVALLTVFALADIRLSTRTQLVFASLGVLLLVILACVILGKGGAHGVNLQPFNFHNAGTAHDFFYAMVFAFTGFIGFEAAASLGEESAEPLKMIPKAILSAVLVALVFYVFVTWAMSLGFGVDNSAAWASNPGALDTLATQYVGSWFATLVDIAVVVDAFVAALAGTALVSRTAFAMGREGGLPKVFAWTHPRFKTPWVSIIASLVLTVILVSWLARGVWNDPFTYFAFMATTATFGILGTYILVSLGGISVLLADQGDVGGRVQRPLGHPPAGDRDRRLRADDLLVDHTPAAEADQLLDLGRARLARARPGVPDRPAASERRTRSRSSARSLAEGGEADSPPAAEAVPT